MNRTVPEDFQRKLDQFNTAQGGPSRVEVAWNPKSSRWEVWAVPTEIAGIGKFRDVTARLRRPFPDDSSREGIKLFTWEEYNEKGQRIGFLPLDNRIFDALRWADSFRSKNHFDETIKNPEIEKEVRSKAHIRAVAAGTANYWANLDRTLVSMNPGIKAKAAWRDAGHYR